jgi:DNA invertase Pin-like site-specific DNA recombinase
MEEQIELVSNYCKAKGLDLAICFCDDGVSAHKVERDEMSKLLDIIESGDIIVTKNFSRFTRNPIAQQMIIDNMNSRGVKIVCADEEDEDDSAPSMMAWFKTRWAK